MTKTEPQSREKVVYLVSYFWVNCLYVGNRSHLDRSWFFCTWPPPSLFLNTALMQCFDFFAGWMMVNLSMTLVFCIRIDQHKLFCCLRTGSNIHPSDRCNRFAGRILPLKKGEVELRWLNWQRCFSFSCLIWVMHALELLTQSVFLLDHFEMLVNLARFWDTGNTSFEGFEIN